LNENLGLWPNPSAGRVHDARKTKTKKGGYGTMSALKPEEDPLVDERILTGKAAEKSTSIKAPEKKFKTIILANG